jgi:hypothetical protein
MRTAKRMPLMTLGWQAWSLVVVLIALVIAAGLVAMAG